MKYNFLFLIYALCFAPFSIVGMEQQLAEQIAAPLLIDLTASDNVLEEDLLCKASIKRMNAAWKNFDPSKRIKIFGTPVAPPVEPSIEQKIKDFPKISFSQEEALQLSHIASTHSKNSQQDLFSQGLKKKQKLEKRIKQVDKHISSLQNENAQLKKTLSSNIKQKKIDSDKAFLDEIHNKVLKICQQKNDIDLIKYLELLEELLLQTSVTNLLPKLLHYDAKSRLFYMILKNNKSKFRWEFIVNTQEFGISMLPY